MTKNKFLNLNSKKILVGFFILIFLIFSSGFLISKYNLWKADMRDKARRNVINQIVEKVEIVKKDTGSYPEAVFFTENTVLICPKVDCLISEEIEIDGASKASPDLDNTTTRHYTKYAYELSEDGYKLSYCNENAEAQNFGNSSLPIEINCH